MNSRADTPRISLANVKSACRTTMAVAALFIAIPLTAANDPPPVTTQPATHAVESRENGPRALGRTLVSAMPTIAADIHREFCFELAIDNQTVGYVVSTLKSIELPRDAERPARRGYDYSDLSVLRGPTGEGTELRTNGILNPYFQPETVTWETTSLSRSDKPVGVLKETLTVAGKDVVFKSGDGTGMKAASLPLGKERFVHLAGSLFSLLPLQAGQRFALRDFDTETRALVWRTYTVSKKEDGRLRISVEEPGGAAESAYYVLNRDGTVALHGTAGSPFVFKQCTRERVEAIMRTQAEAAKPERPIKGSGSK